MLKEKISVIIPIYNVEEYLDKCIKSIINQSYRNLEIILVNDGSTDNSLSICNRYKKNDNRIILINKKNGGLSSARNAGMEVATGQYISFIDGDDYIDLDMYESIYKIIELKKPDIVEVGVNYIYKDRVDYMKERELTVNNIKALEYFLNRNEIFKAMACNKVYKKEVLKKIKFKEGYIHEDAFFTYKVFLNAKKISHLGLSKYNYVQQREGSIMNESFTKKRIVVLEAFEERSNILKKLGFHNLVNLSDREYLETLIELYYKFKDSNYNDYNLEKFFEIEIKKNYNLKMNKTISLNVKLKYILYFINPYLYYSLDKVRRKIGRRKIGRR